MTISTVTTERLKEIKALAASIESGNGLFNAAEIDGITSELLAVRVAQPVGISKIIQIAAELVKGDLLSALWQEAERSKIIRTERLQRLLDDAGEAMKVRATQLKQACEHPAAPAPAVQTVPDAITVDNAPEIFEIAAQVERIGLSGAYGAYASGWNACRAAMLQPASQGYTLNSPVIPDCCDTMPNGQPVLPDDYFSTLVNAARLAADKAMQKHPQPNYVLLKVAEEAGEVVQAGVHYAEGRMTWQDLEGEIVQLLAMLIRLVTEGDQVNGITPPLPAASQ